MKATKNYAGSYSYKGYEIVNVGDHWNIVDGNGWVNDAAETKRDAMWMIDEMETRGITSEGNK